MRRFHLLPWNESSTYLCTMQGWAVSGFTGLVRSARLYRFIFWLPTFVIRRCSGILKRSLLFTSGPCVDAKYNLYCKLCCLFWLFIQNYNRHLLTRPQPFTDSILTKYLQKHINTQNQCHFPLPSLSLVVCSSQQSLSFPLTEKHEVQSSVLKGVFVANRLAVPLKHIYNNQWCHLLPWNDSSTRLCTR